MAHETLPTSERAFGSCGPHSQSSQNVFGIFPGHQRPPVPAYRCANAPARPAERPARQRASTARSRQLRVPHSCCTAHSPGRREEARGRERADRQRASSPGLLYLSRCTNLVCTNQSEEPNNVPDPGPGVVRAAPALRRGCVAVRRRKGVARGCDAPRWGADACVPACFRSLMRGRVPASCAIGRESRCATVEAATGSPVRSPTVARPFPPPPSPARRSSPPLCLKSLVLSCCSLPAHAASAGWSLRRTGCAERGTGTSGGARHADFPCGQLPIGPCCLSR